MTIHYFCTLNPTLTVTMSDTDNEQIVWFSWNHIELLCSPVQLFPRVDECASWFVGKLSSCKRTKHSASWPATHLCLCVNHGKHAAVDWITEASVTSKALNRRKLVVMVHRCLKQRSSTLIPRRVALSSQRHLHVAAHTTEHQLSTYGRQPRAFAIATSSAWSSLPDLSATEGCFQFQTLLKHFCQHCTSTPSTLWSFTRRCTIQIYTSSDF